MEDFLSMINSYETINKIYSYDLFEISDISKLLGIELEDHDLKIKSELDISDIDRAVEMIARDEKSKFVYGEIKRESVDDLSKFISKKIETKTSSFCDIGSGHGKLAMHRSLISEFRDILGIEISKVRSGYAKAIKAGSGISATRSSAASARAMSRSRPCNSRPSPPAWPADAPSSHI